MLVPNQFRIIYFMIGCLCVFIMLLLQNFYRPWIYYYHYFDFYLADTFTNLLGVNAVFFCVIGLFHPKYICNSPIKPLFGITLGLVLYELLDLGLICDYKDIIASYIGALLAFSIHWYLKKRWNK